MNPGPNRPPPPARRGLLLPGLVGGLIAVTVLGFVGWTSYAAAARSAAAREVEQLLHAQQSAWNAGDLDGFMGTYWMSDELTFYSDAEAKGWVPLHERYERKYRTGRATMGELDFPALDVQVLAADAAVVRGRWKLTRDGKTNGGFFTLIVRKKPEGWKIVHDHTSEEKTP